MILYPCKDCTMQFMACQDTCAKFKVMKEEKEKEKKYNLSKNYIIDAKGRKIGGWVNK